MTTKTHIQILFSAILLLLAGLVGSCKDKEKDKVETTNLTGTQWKLAGIVNASTGEMQELEPKDCEKCFTLSFDTDSTLSGHSSENDQFGKYIADYKTQNISITDLWGTELIERGDGNLFLQTLISIQSFSSQSGDLRLYYNDKQNYLLFKTQKL